MTVERKPTHAAVNITKHCYDPQKWSVNVISTCRMRYRLPVVIEITINSAPSVTQKTQARCASHHLVSGRHMVWGSVHTRRQQHVLRVTRSVCMYVCVRVVCRLQRRDREFRSGFGQTVPQAGSGAV